MDKKPLIVVSILSVVLLLITSMDCMVSANPILNHSVTIEITGQNIQHQRTINVSGEVLQEIKQVFADVSVNLEFASSPEEKLLAYWNACQSLYDLGVLGSLSCEDAYRLVTRWYRPSKTLSLLHPLQESNNTNTYCLVSGRVDYSISSNRASNLMNRFTWDYLARLWPGSSIPLIIAIVILMLVTGSIGSFLQFVVERNPLAFGNLIGIGAYDNYAKEGWIKTSGLYGTKNWDGNLIGGLPGYIHLWPVYYYQAMWGFFGIKIRYDSSWVGYNASYLGSALVVGINDIG